MTGSEPDVAHGAVVHQPLASENEVKQNGHGRSTERSCCPVPEIDYF